MMLRRLRRRLALLVLLPLSACGVHQKWQAADVSVDPDVVAREISPELARQVAPSDIPYIPPPGHLRPCCAFGSDIHVSVMAVPVLGFRLPNVFGVDDLGPHKYDNGALAFEASRPGGAAMTDEHNGLIYTCRGGFIDIAHVRDWADWSLFFAARLGRSLEDGIDVPLPGEGGRRRVEVWPLPAGELRGHDRRRVVIGLAQWIAFQLSVWHEIATWYGWSAIPIFPEEASAFSPEDLYSNLLGIKIAGALMYQSLVTSEASYNENMESALRMMLERLDAQPGELGRRAAHAVDGQWWDSRVALPSKALVIRRNFDDATALAGWLVQQASTSNDDTAAIVHACGTPKPVVLGNPDTCATGRPFADYVEIAIDVDAALAERGFPFPRPGSRRITQRDFPFVIERIRLQNAVEFGTHADRPD